MRQGGEEISSPAAASIQLPGSSGPVGIPQLLWGYLLLGQFSAPWDGDFHPHVSEFVSALGSGSFWEWAGGLWGLFGGLHPSLFVLATPWHHFCPEEENWLRRVFPYLCTAPSFQAHPGPILTLTPHCPAFHRMLQTAGNCLFKWRK